VISAHYFGFESLGWQTQAAAVFAALLGALLLTYTERKRPEVQEALIGILFVLASTAQILLLANDPHGGEDLKDLLAGQILWVSPQQLIRAAVVTGLFLLVWFRWREKVGRIGFYVMFAFVVTVSVQLVGVYLVFTSLIVPAVATYRYRPKLQLGVGYALAIASYLAGLVLSAVTDLPSSAVIVWAMAAIALIVHLSGGNAANSRIGASSPWVRSSQRFSAWSSRKLAKVWRTFCDMHSGQRFCLSRIATRVTTTKRWPPSRQTRSRRAISAPRPRP